MFVIEILLVERVSLWLMNKMVISYYYQRFGAAAIITYRYENYLFV